MNGKGQTASRQAAPIERSWRLVCLLIVALFLLRGGALLSILPPFEGWDEYQHFARIAFVAEQGQSPIVNESMVPRSLYAAIASLPHGRLDLEQTRRVGALPYLADVGATPPVPSYWDGPPPAPVPNAPDIPLYQAQHGPLYYWMMTPVYKALWDPARPLDCIYALRLINLAFGAAAIGAALWSLGQLVSSVRQRIWIALLLGVQPLFLLNAARIANDAPAVFFAIAATGVLLVRGRRAGLWFGVVAGVLAGLAVLAKSVALVILPLAVAAPLVGLWKRETTTGRLVMHVAAFFVLFFIVTGSYFYGNWSTYGVAVPMQESVKNQALGHGFAEMVTAAGQIDWWRQFRSRVGRDSLWVGGWSFLVMPSAVRGIHEGLVAIALLGLLLTPILLRRRRVALDSLQTESGLRPWLDPPNAALLILVVAGSLAGLAYHTLQSKMAYGTITTNVWYACLVFPWMIALLVLGADAYRFRAAAAWTGAMLALSITAECLGLFSVMMKGYTGFGWSAEARARLASVHPAWLSPSAAMPMEIAAIVLAMIVFYLSVRMESISPPSRLRPSAPPSSPAR